MKTQVIAIAAALGGALASPVAVMELLRRQLPCADIASYFKLVNTALFAVNYVNSFSHPCDTSLIPYFDSQGLNGRYAVDIICLYDAGVQLFDEPLEVVNDNLIVTLIGLFDAFGSITDPSRNLSCANVNTNVLEELELDSAVIKNIICDYSPCTTGVNTTSSSIPASTSSCMTGTASTMPPSRSASSTAPPGTSMSASSRPPCTGSSSSSVSSIGSRSTSSVTVSTSSVSGSGSSSSSGPASSVTAPPSSSSISVYPPPQTYY